MKLTDEDIREFIDIWRREFGETLSPEEAHERASRLLSLYARIAKSLRRADRETS